MPVGAIIAGAGVLGGAIQAFGGAAQARNAQNALENLQTPTYTPSSSILDYYNKTLQRYSVNPYDSPLYKMQQENIQRSGATGITALQGGRNAIGGVSNIVQAQNDALLKAGTTAQQEQGQELNQLGTAAGAETHEQDKAFQYNQLAPYQKQYNLDAMKAGAGAQIENAGLSNIFNGLGSASNALLANQIYGTSNTGTSSNNLPGRLNGSVNTIPIQPSQGQLQPSILNY